MLKKFTAACSLITACLSFPAHAQFSYTETLLGDGLMYQPLDAACRITDSRQAASGGALAHNTTRTLTVRGISDFSTQGGTVAGQGTNVVGLNAAYGPTNDMVIKLKAGAAPHMDAYANTTGNPVHFIVDVAGYFYRHTRTCTEVAGTSAAIATTATLVTPTCPANFAFDHGGCDVLSGITGAVH